MPDVINILCRGSIRCRSLRHWSRRSRYMLMVISVIHIPPLRLHRHQSPSMRKKKRLCQNASMTEMFGVTGQVETAGDRLPWVSVGFVAIIHDIVSNRRPAYLMLSFRFTFYVG